MKLIIDSNIVISALIRDSKTREIILDSNIEFFYPEIGLRNLGKHKQLIMKKAGISEYEYNQLYNILFERVVVIKDETFLGKLDQAKEIMGSIDMEDVPFIALALSIENDGIWSDDYHFQKQKDISVYTTEELVREV
jgi:predicted nucleic acid-binding protein